jgi:hypothetical protein
MNRSSNWSAAQLQQWTELDYLLLGDLREMLDEALTPQARKWMLSILDVLLENLPREHRLKSVDGYLHEVLVEFPNWSGHVDRLESEDYELYDRLSDLRDHLELDTLEPEAVKELRYRLQEWMQALVTHRMQETSLLLAAVNTDIGGG